MMNRKLRKLLRNPRDFFKDSRLILAIRRLLKLNFPLSKVGDNWNNTKAPVAIMLGFMPWKREYVARYLHEFRTLFAENNGPIERYTDKILAYAPLCIIIWGYNEAYDVTAFSARHAIPVYRMEDGFLRSRSLGSAHTRPYSLVLDKSSLYFNAKEPSDLEKLLATYDFDQSPELLRHAEQLIAFQREFGISKYNLPVKKKNGFKDFAPQKRRVLVIGQVEDDKSILYGTVGRWNCARLLQLACEENPDCEVLYRQHPDVVLSKRTDNVCLGTLSAQCRVVDSDGSLSDLFSLVERVYVITSLSGFEALLHGLPVTTVGMPFYAGWGLTDDRCLDHHRNRTLTLTELYAAAYLLYPRYILNLQNSLDGCQKTLFKLCEEKNDIELLGADWTNSEKPVALLYGVESLVCRKLTESLTGYRLARICNKDANLISIGRTMNAKKIFIGTALPKSIVDQVRQEHIKLVSVLRGLDCTGTTPNAGCAMTLVLEPFSVEQSQSPKPSGRSFERLIALLEGFPLAEHAEQISSMKTLLPLNHLITRSIGQLIGRKSLQDSLPLMCKGDRVLILARRSNDVHVLERLAHQEHPDGEFFIFIEEQESSNHILPPDCHVLPRKILQQSLEFIDCVYTHDSLFVLDALRCKIPVVVTGTPFYAGWGFTDDRQPIIRSRQLSIEDFFYAVFILYPCYIENSNDSLTGFLIESLKNPLKHLEKELHKRTFGLSVEINNSVKPSKDVQFKTLLKELSELYQTPGWYTVVVCLLWNFGNKNERSQLLNWAEKQLSANILKELFQLLAQKDGDIRWRLARIYASSGNSIEARLLLTSLQDQSSEYASEEKLAYVHKAPPLQLARIFKASHEAKLSRQQYLLALTGGKISLDLLEEVADIYAECMDFEGSAALFRLLYSLAVQAKKPGVASRALVGLTVSMTRLGRCEEALLCLAFLSSKSMNEAMRAVDVTQTFWVRHFPSISIYSCIRSWAGDSGTLEKRVKIRMFASEFDEAISLMDSNIQEVSNNLQLSLLYARIKFFQGEYNEAERAYDYIMRRFGRSPSTCYNFIYFCLHSGRYDKLTTLMEFCQRVDFANKAYFMAWMKLNQRDIGGSFPDLCGLDNINAMRHLLGDKCVCSLNDVYRGERLLVVACSGVGDEIGNAIFYQRITEYCNGQTTFTCDPRLYSFFTRSLPNVHLEPVQRLRYITDLSSSFEEYAELPSSAFISMFNNRGYALFKEADKVILDFDAVRSVVKGYEDFFGLAHMKADEELVRQYRAQLPDDGKLNVGLCWRSALKRYSRARNYCSIEDFAPLLQRNDVHFVLLQYDGCSPHESAWLEKEFPGKTMYFEHLNMFEDLDGLAAAIFALDLIISPAVNIRQLSGCQDVPTSFLVSGSGLDWRREEYGEHDLIYKNTVHRRIENREVLMDQLQVDINKALERKRSCES